MKPNTTKIRACLRTEGVTSEVLDDAQNELRRIEENCIDQSAIPKAAQDYINARYPYTDRVLAKMLNVQQLLRGTIKVKDDSDLIFMGLTLQVLGLFCEWPNGSKEYAVSLVGTKFEKERDREFWASIGERQIESINVKPWSVEEQ
jgi:hypothetical protein